MIGEVCTRDVHCDREDCCFKRENKPNNSCLCDRPECRRKANAEIILHLSREEYTHIMGSVSQDDVEYRICPNPLKLYLEDIAKRNDVKDSLGYIYRIGW